MKLNSKRCCFMRVLTLFVFILLGNTKNCVSAKESHLYSMEVSINFNQYVKCNRTANVLVHVRSKKANFNGYIMAIPKTQESQLRCIYKKAVSVSNGVESIEFSIPIDGKAKKVEFQLISQSGKVVLSQEKKLKIERDSSVAFLGIIGKQKYDSDIDGKVVRPVIIPYEEIPRSVEGLDSFESILVKSDLLDHESVSSLKYVREWNREGGTLLISGYSDSLVQYMRGDRRGKKTIRDEKGRMIYNVFPNRKGVLIEWLYSESLIELLSENKVDSVRLLYDLKSHYSDIKQEQINNEESGRELGEKELIKSLEYLGREHLPRPVQYAVLLLVYVVFVGPGLFLFLRHRNKEMYYYAAVAITSAAFIGIFMAVGMRTALEKSIMHTVTIYDYDDVSDSVEEESYFSIVAPSRKNEKFTVRKKADINLKNVQIESGIPFMSVRGKKKYDVAIQKKATSVSIEIARPLYMKPYVFKSTSKVKRKEEIVSSLKYDGKRISGFIENELGYNLENVILLSNYHMISLGCVDDGQRVIVPNYQKVINCRQMYRGRSELKYGETRMNMNLERDRLLEYQKAATLRYCMRGKCSQYGNETYLIGFISGKKKTCKEKDLCTKKDIKVIVYRIRNVSNTYRKKTILNDISKYEVISAGAINPNTRTMRSYYAVADYYIPSDTKLVSLWFNHSMNMNAYYKGTVSIFNNRTQEFEKIYRGGSSKSISNLDKKDYLMNGNVFRLKYTLPVEEEYIEKNELPVISAMLEVK